MRVQIAITALIGLSECRNKQQPIVLKPEGIQQPLLGFGTWNLKENPDNTTNVVTYAIEIGYRQIDCAAAYGNEEAVGKGIHKGLKKAGIKREDIWVTSKLWNDHHTPSLVALALTHTLTSLNLTYLDLYLMHWPVGKSPSDEKYHEDYLSTWHAMTLLLATGRVRHIGVSNFSPAQLKDLIEHSAVKPAVHQMELHPYLPQKEWIQLHEANGIAVTAYSPLGNTNPTYTSKAPPLLGNHVISSIAERCGCTPAQVALAWGMARGTSVIPKSKHEAYIAENFGAGKCVLAAEDLAEIDGLGEVPVRFNNPGKAWGVRLFEGLEDA